MGCDIHIYTEKRVNGKWISADNWKKSEWAESDADLSVTPEIYEGRNYNLFAILADVRNGRGFAGIKTGEGFTPISPPKGLPEDVSEQVKAASDRYGCDGHSHTFLTVAEIMAFDWTQTSKLEGCVDAENFEEWDRWRRARGEGPESYSGDTFGRDIVHLTPEQMKERVDAAKKLCEDMRGSSKWTDKFRELTKGLHTRIQWELPYYKCDGGFLQTVLPRLWRLGSP